MKRALSILRIALGVAGLLLFALGFVAPPGRHSVACLIVGGVIVFAMRETKWQERYDAVCELLRGPSQAREMLRESEREKLADDAGRARYSCFVFEYPMLEYPRRPFRRVLARHRDVLRANLPALPFLLRKQSVTVDAFTKIDEYVCVIDASAGAPPRVVVRGRYSTQEQFREFVRVARRLYAAAEPGSMFALVEDDDALSLHELTLTERPLPDGNLQRTFSLAPEELTFEPRAQNVERYGNVVIRSWRPTATSRAREHRVTMRPAARSREECLDRLFAASQAAIRASLERHVRRGEPTGRLLVKVSTYRELGPQASVVSVDREGWHKTLEHFPESERLVASRWPAGWMPVFLCHEHFGGIRWLGCGEEAQDGEPPPSVTECDHGGARFPERVYDQSG